MFESLPNAGGLRFRAFAAVLLLLSCGVSLRAEPWYSTDGPVDSSPALGWNGMIYVGSEDGSLHLIGPDGTSFNKFETDNWIHGTPAVGDDGTIYIGNWDFYLFAIKPDGTAAWDFEATGFIYSSPAIGPLGEIYFGASDHILYAVGSDGILEWEFTTDGWIISSPTVAPNGTIYVGTLEGSLYALDPHGLEISGWESPFNAGEAIYSSPAIAADGTIYIGGDDRLLAISPEKEKIAEFSPGEEDWIDSSPAIGPDGMIYVGAADGNLYALDPRDIAEDGSWESKWTFSTDDAIYSSPAIAADGSILFTSMDGYLYSVSSGGEENWREPVGGESESSPLIAPDGTIYVGSTDGNLYAFSGSSPAAATPWAMFRGNRARNGRNPVLFDPWINEFVSTPEAQEPLADPDGDGIPNLLEYAFRKNPTVADRSFLPDGNWATEPFAFTIDLQRVDLLYQPQYSTDLIHWHDLDHEALDPAPAIQDHRTNIPAEAAEADRMFFRLQVTRF